jgi:hypothetical protein
MSRPEQQDGGQDEVRSTPPVSDAEIEADLGRDSTGGQPGAGHADQSHNATDDKELHALLGLDTDDSTASRCSSRGRSSSRAAPTST